MPLSPGGASTLLSGAGQRDCATPDGAGAVGAQDGAREERHREIPEDARGQQDPARHGAGKAGEALRPSSLVTKTNCCRFPSRPLASVEHPLGWRETGSDVIMRRLSIRSLISSMKGGYVPCAVEKRLSSGAWSFGRVFVHVRLFSVICS